MGSTLLPQMPFSGFFTNTNQSNPPSWPRWKKTRQQNTDLQSLSYTTPPPGVRSFMFPKPQCVSQDRRPILSQSLCCLNTTHQRPRVPSHRNNLPLAQRLVLVGTASEPLPWPWQTSGAHTFLGGRALGKRTIGVGGAPWNCWHKPSRFWPTQKDTSNDSTHRVFGNT